MATRAQQIEAALRDLLADVPGAADAAQAALALPVLAPIPACACGSEGAVRVGSWVCRTCGEEWVDEAAAELVVAEYSSA